MDKTEFFTFPPDTALPMRVDMAGREYCPPDYAISRQGSPIGVLGCLIEGAGVIHTGGEELPAQAGDLFLLPKGSSHDYFNYPDDPWVMLWFNMDGDLFNHLLEAYRLRGQVVFQKAAGELEPLFRQGIDYCRNGRGEKEQPVLCALIHQIIAELGRWYGRLEEQPSRQCKEIKQYMDAYLQQGGEGVPCLEALGRQMGLSQRHLVRIFKEERGETPYRYYLRARIEQAKQYLSHTHMPVKEIGARLGFFDAYHFSRQFKAEVGRSPTDYRSANR